MDIGYHLKNVALKEERSRCLVEELCKINVNLPARVWLPLYAHSLKHIVLRIPPLAGCILNSKDKVLFICSYHTRFNASLCHRVDGK